MPGLAVERAEHLVLPVALVAQRRRAHGFTPKVGTAVRAHAVAARRAAVAHRDHRREAQRVEELVADRDLPLGAREREVLAEGEAAAAQLEFTRKL
jgi:hypothetical protein